MGEVGAAREVESAAVVGLSTLAIWSVHWALVAARRLPGSGVSDLTPSRPDLAVAAALGADIPQRCRVSVDLSHAESTNRLAVGFEDCDYIPDIGELVDACDLIEHQEATAEVLGIDDHDRIIRIAVDWTTVRDAPST